MGCCESTEESRHLLGSNSTFRPFHDKYETVEEVQEALRNAGLESSNLILGVDFTKSNEYNGRYTFAGRPLHAISPTGEMNPYQRAISIIGATLEPFDDDKLIPAFGFGDVSTKDKGVFPFFPDNRPCNTFREVLSRYTEITPLVQLSGPTSFAPIINEAISIVRQSKEYHILVIIADGQVTSARETVNAIVQASNYPLSIVVVGVGDGPWEMMEEFDDGLPQRKFDNFQFVNFHKVTNTRFPEPSFALAALMELPEQYKAIRKLGLL
jgi:E3 ubiquitin-protein ligase RGLG